MGLTQRNALVDRSAQLISLPVSVGTGPSRQRGGLLRHRSTARYKYCVECISVAAHVLIWPADHNGKIDRVTPMTASGFDCRVRSPLTAACPVIVSVPVGCRLQKGWAVGCHVPAFTPSQSLPIIRVRSANGPCAMRRKCRTAINWRPAKTWGDPPQGDKLSRLAARLWRGKCGGWSGSNVKMTVASPM